MEMHKQVATKAASFRKANPDASSVAILRQTAKAMKSATRGDFIEAFGKAPFKLSEHTVSRQFYVGRGAPARSKTKAKKSARKAKKS